MVSLIASDLRRLALLDACIFSTKHAASDISEEHCLAGTDVVATEVLPGALYISAACVARHAKEFDVVVNCAAEVEVDAAVHIPARDNPEYPLLSTHFLQFSRIVEAAFTRGHRVLVHCNQGRNRSVALVAAYLVKRFGLPLADLVFFLRKQRGTHILTNRGFQMQLIQLASNTPRCLTADVCKLRDAIDHGATRLMHLSPERQDMTCLQPLFTEDFTRRVGSGNYFGAFGTLVKPAVSANV